MSAFEENVIDYTNVMGLSESDIIELSGLTEDQLNTIEDKITKDDQVKFLYQFCFNVGIDYSSIYANFGFKSATIEQQYDKLPPNLKKCISVMFIRSLAKMIGSKDMLRVQLRSKFSESSTMLTRVLTGSSAIESKHLKAIVEAMAGIISEFDVRYTFAQTMWSRIPNYNMKEGMKHFKILYSQLAQSLGITASGVSNWGCVSCTPIPYTMCKHLSAIFGVSVEEFTTQIMSDKSFKCKAVSFDQPVKSKSKTKTKPKFKLPDPVSDDKPAKTVDKTVEPCEPNINTSNHIEPDMTEMNPVSRDNNHGVSISLSSEELNKAFNALTEENKLKINEMIIKLLLSQI